MALELKLFGTWKIQILEFGSIQHICAIFIGSKIAYLYIFKYQI